MQDKGECRRKGFGLARFGSGPLGQCLAGIKQPRRTIVTTSSFRGRERRTGKRAGVVSLVRDHCRCTKSTSGSFDYENISAMLNERAAVQLHGVSMQLAERRSCFKCRDHLELNQTQTSLSSDRNAL